MMIPIDQLRIDPRLQQRVALPTETIEAIESLLRESGESADDEWPDALPPLGVVHDEKEKVYWLWDGHCRHTGAMRAGQTHAKCSLTLGDFRRAWELSLGANAAHGSRRTDADIAKVLKSALEDSQTGKWSDREIARLCCVGRMTVARHRLASVPCGTDARVREVKRGGKTFTQDTSNIGRKPAAAMPTPEIPERFKNRNGPIPAAKPDSEARKQKPRDNPHADLPKSVQNALADTWHADCARMLANMMKQCKGAFSWSSWLDASVLDHLKAAQECFLTAIPKKACPECKGHKTIDKKQCQNCRGGGYMASQV